MSSVPGDEVFGNPGGLTRTQMNLTGTGASIGPYRLLERLGEGGMGEVWLAEQSSPVRRRVAIKILKAGLDTAQVVARFEAERQALAVMDHSAIAKVFDAGSTDHGRPYFAMEYVQGDSLTAYCDRERLTIRERLDLFVHVCEGVHHAHQKGIIHRDLKPSNILVTPQDDRPVPKIIDFGVAKATRQPLTEHTLYTSLGGFLGTPEYMSPEQAEMGGVDIDTRTDVYALGVILYELLTGVLPFDRQQFVARGLDEMRRTIRESEPPRPSTRITQLRDGSAEAALFPVPARGSRLDHDEGAGEGSETPIRVRFGARRGRPPTPCKRAGGGRASDRTVSLPQVRPAASDWSRRSGGRAVRARRGGRRDGCPGEAHRPRARQG
jgi:serine/threonine protein kinase